MLKKHQPGSNKLKTPRQAGQQPRAETLVFLADEGRSGTESTRSESHEDLGYLSDINLSHDHAVQHDKVVVGHVYR